MSQDEFDRIVHEARALQEHIPWLELVVVGGTAASLHAAHRYSLDADEVSMNLSDNYEVALGEVLRWEGWQTNRTSRPYVILGERHGVRLGIRQQIRPIALDTEDRDGLIIPTAEETLRIKAFLAFKRRAVRDYLDVAALADLLGPERTAEAISWLNVLYEGEGNQTAATKFAEAVAADPQDLGKVDLRTYRGIRAPYNDWAYVADRCREIGEALFLREMEKELPTDVQEFIDRQNRRGTSRGTPGGSR